MSQQVLEEEFDEDYEPTEEEIAEYAKFLGMDPHTDQDLFWIARESLKAPLPPNWKPCQNEDGNIYYFNFTTGESIWDHPCDEHYRKLYDREKAKRDERPYQSNDSLSSEVQARKKSTDESPLLSKTPDTLLEPKKLGPLPSLGKPALGPLPALTSKLPPQKSSEFFEDWSPEGSELDLPDDSSEKFDQPKATLPTSTAQKQSKPPPEDIIKNVMDRINDADSVISQELSHESHDSIGQRVPPPSNLKAVPMPKLIEQQPPKEGAQVGGHQKLDDVRKVEEAEQRTAVDNLRRKFKDDFAEIERAEKAEFEKDVEGVRAKWKQEETRTQKEIEEKHQHAVEDLKQKLGKELQAVETEEQERFRRDVQAIRDRHAHQLRKVEAEENNIMAAKATELARTQNVSQEEADQVDKEIERIKANFAADLKWAQEEERRKFEMEIDNIKKDYKDRKQRTEMEERERWEHELKELRQQLQQEYSGRKEQERATFSKSMDEEAARRKKDVQQSHKEQIEQLQLDLAKRLDTIRSEHIKKEAHLMREEEERRSRLVGQAKEDTERRIKAIEDEAKQKEEGLRAKLTHLDAEAAKALSSSTADLAALQRENEVHLERQKRQKEQLIREKEELQQISKDLTSRRQQLQEEERRMSQAQSEALHRESKAVDEIEADVLARRARLDRERASLTTAERELVAMRQRLEDERSALVALEKELVGYPQRVQGAPDQDSNIIAGGHSVGQCAGISNGMTNGMRVGLPDVNTDRIPLPSNKGLKELAELENVHQDFKHRLSKLTKRSRSKRKHGDAARSGSRKRDSLATSEFGRLGNKDLDLDDTSEASIGADPDLRARVALAPSETQSDTSSSENLSGSPTHQLHHRIKREERQLYKAKRFLQRQRQSIEDRQWELERARSQWKDDIDKIAQRLDVQGGDEGMPLDELELQHPSHGKHATLDEIEGELGKLLGVLRSTRLQTSRPEKQRYISVWKI
ncbi:hypothetical protein HDV00_004723 [Rhizophlyctis rosea]|nr:hypothetical protein HDV00_004723 [Rhizophlyctis rosea]